MEKHAKAAVRGVAKIRAKAAARPTALTIANTPARGRASRPSCDPRSSVELPMPQNVPVLIEGHKSWEEGRSKNVTFVVTEDCQLRCRYCYMVGKNKAGRLKLDIAEKAIDYLPGAEGARAGKLRRLGFHRRGALPRDRSHRPDLRLFQDPGL